MDGSFALAILVALGMSFANLALLVFGLGLFLLEQFATWKRLLCSAIVSVFAILCALLLGRQVLDDRGSHQIHLEALPQDTIPITLLTVLFFGCASFIYILIVVFRAKTSRLWSFSRWLLIPAALVHIGLSAVAFYLMWSFAFGWFEPLAGSPAVYPFVSEGP